MAVCNAFRPCWLLCAHTLASHSLPPTVSAALNGHAAVVEKLVAACCDVDLQSQNGSSALHNAASGAGVAAAGVAAGDSRIYYAVYRLEQH